MLNKFLALAALVASFATQAATLTLEPGICGSGTCTVNTDTGDQATVFFSTQYQTVGVVLDGRGYTSQSAQVTNQGFGPTLCFAPDGSYVTLQATFTYWITKGNGSGKGGYRQMQHWFLASGSVVTP